MLCHARRSPIITTHEMKRNLIETIGLDRIAHFGVGAVSAEADESTEGRP